ncbi:transcriptional regulator, MarR family [Catenulispora acidiphila DSM 44928]|uniref:Transcriptional regulator, MarR family n=1 Tax=Catenulispora acidiphila (strain DSM 44928 / JCM 14897 / NBRC 102108 / NRRL B-24433 / ID139908) TaxID=479433 RepID=C7QHD4_CATAD|nr:MarR family transcriptional regulator [Catenulispora acidiphila]ACU69073.1 transcriptional regulator, MarR family [Catenulispora acidiphila DSM 44928]
METPHTQGLDAATPADNGAPAPAAPAASDPQACRDEVDRLVEAWRHERPDLDVAPLEVLSRVSRLARHLDRARRTAFAEHDLEPWEFDVLSALRRAGAPYQLTPSKLLTQTLVTSGTMTNRIDRLAAKDLVKRLPDPGDRRGVLVQLSDTGRERVDGAFEGLLAQERELLGGLSAGDRTTLAALLRTLVLPFDN